MKKITSNVIKSIEKKINDYKKYNPLEFHEMIISHEITGTTKRFNSEKVYIHLNKSKPVFAMFFDRRSDSKCMFEILEADKYKLTAFKFVIGISAENTNKYYLSVINDSHTTEELYETNPLVKDVINTLKKLDIIDEDLKLNLS